MAKSYKWNGHSFPSRTEMECYKQLLLIEEEGRIRDIEFQPKLYFTLPDGRDIRTYKGHKTMTYTPDFKATCNRSGQTIYYEAKGWPRPEFKIRFAVARALFPDCQFRMFRQKEGFVETI